MKHLFIMRKISIGFVTYYPSINLLSRIELALSEGFVLYIFDNSPHLDDIRIFCRTHDNCHYFTCGKNLGLGLGITSVCAQAYYDSHRALLFFDQDTIFSADTLNTIEEFFKTNQQIVVDYSAVVFNASNVIVRDSSEACFKEVDLSRNSGSLFFLDNLKKIKWHNENYFVDGVDYEFCLRSRRHGLKIGEYSCTPGFDHEAEQGDKKYVIFGKTLHIRKYALSRVADVVHSSIRIVAKSLLLGELRFAARIIRLLFIYVAVQIYARVQNS